MGKYDSSKTRVKPVFDWIYAKDPSGLTWLARLLSLPVNGNKVLLPGRCDFEIQEHAWEPLEIELKPPVALLSWLVRHPQKLAQSKAAGDPSMPDERRELLGGSETRILEALDLLRHNPQGKRWHIFEGDTRPDVFITTRSLVVVIEGKRTEHEPTTDTTLDAGTPSNSETP
jgi:hypothetical protein